MAVLESVWTFFWLAYQCNRNWLLLISCYQPTFDQVPLMWILGRQAVLLGHDHWFFVVLSFAVSSGNYMFLSYVWLLIDTMLQRLTFLSSSTSLLLISKKFLTWWCPLVKTAVQETMFQGRAQDDGWPRVKGLICFFHLLICETCTF